jgi:hypothetical protein
MTSRLGGGLGGGQIIDGTSNLVEAKSLTELVTRCCFYNVDFYERKKFESK